MAAYSQEMFERGRAYAREHPAPEHVVAAINRALRAPRAGERGEGDDGTRRLAGQVAP